MDFLLWWFIEFLLSHFRSELAFGIAITPLYLFFSLVVYSLMVQEVLDRYSRDILVHQLPLTIEHSLGGGWAWEEEN